MAALRLLNGTGSAVWLLILLAIALVSARGLFGQALLFARSLSPGRPAVWEQDGELVYLSPLYARLPLSEVDSISQERLRKGFGLQDYAVVRARGGRRMHIHLAVISERFDHLKELIEDEARALA